MSGQSLLKQVEKDNRLNPKVHRPHKDHVTSQMIRHHLDMPIYNIFRKHKMEVYLRWHLSGTEK